LRWGILLGMGGVLGVGSAGFGQVQVQINPPPLPGGAVATTVSNNLNVLVGSMARHVRRLSEVISGDQGTNLGKYSLQDTQELAQALDEFGASLNNGMDWFAARQAFSNFHQSWRSLLPQFTQPGAQSPAINQTVQKIVEDDAQIVQALGLNALPTTYYTQMSAPTGMTDMQRLAQALVDRAAALAAVIRADMVGPGGARPVQESESLVAAADAFHDGIDLNAAPAVARNGFAGVDALTDSLRRDLAAGTPTPRVQVAWQSYLAAEVLLKQSLGLVNTQADLAGTAIVVNGPSPVVALADQLVNQVNAFIQVFSQTAGAVPEGGLFLADAQRLLAAAVNFQQDVARGLNPGQLAYEFRDVDVLWDRLARRTDRIARGRTGPNIQQVGRMGQTVAEIHRLLAIPGYPASVTVAVPAPAPR
jgi:hypothetical protein